MAAWGGVPSTGAWANQVEEEEEENGGELDPVPAPAANAFPALGGDPAFPALGEAINIRDSKKDRKKKNTKNTMSLGAFVAAGKKEPEIVNLPTGPRQRSAEEEEKRGGLGGGFKNYGGDRSTIFTQHLPFFSLKIMAPSMFIHSEMIGESKGSRHFPLCLFLHEKLSFPAFLAVLILIPKHFFTALHTLI